MILSDTLNKSGLIEDCEQRLFGDEGYGRISGDDNLMFQFVNRLNRALDAYTIVAMKSDTNWTWDDNNNTDTPVGRTNIVSGTSQYIPSLTHLEIEKIVMVDNNGNKIILNPASIRDNDSQNFLINQQSGVPTKYFKRGKLIYLDLIPNFNSTLGLIVYYKRGAVYYTTSDLTKSAGIPSQFHWYLSLHASANYAFERQMPIGVASRYRKSLFEQVIQLEKEIGDYLSSRTKDEQPRLSTFKENNK